MTEQKDLSNNPFAALLTGGDVPYSFQSSKEEQETPESQPGMSILFIGCSHINHVYLCYICLAC